MWSSARGSLCAVVVVAVAACARDRAAFAPIPSAALSATLATVVGQPRGVASVEYTLPEHPNRWEASDSALSRALVETKGLAFVGFKSAAMARSSESRSATVESHSGRQLMMGHRSAMSASDVTVALNRVASMGVTILKYYENLGMAYVRMADPVTAASLRTLDVVDFINPEYDTYSLAVVPPTSLLGPRRAPGNRLLRFGFGDMWRSRVPVQGQAVPWGISLVRAPEAWPYSTGSSSRILVIDTGHEQGHADLPLVPTANCTGAFGGCDDPTPVLDGVPHGTFVTGIAMALNNTAGVVGVAPGLQPGNVFVHAACNPYPPYNCLMNEMVAGLNWATANLGPRGVVNMSLGSFTNDPAMSAAVAQATAAGIIVVAAVGNNATSQPTYPAALANVIGVAGVGPTKAFATTRAPCTGSGGSNWGNYVDFVAPFYARSTVPHSDYEDETDSPALWCGTSFAAPHVAGLVALLQTRLQDYSLSSIYTKIRDTAEDLGPAGFDDHYGSGLIRSHLAVAFERPVVTPTIVSGKPRLSWPAIPFATQYKIYRRVTPTTCPEWALVRTQSGTAYTDAATQVASFYGYESQFSATPPQQTLVSYYVTALAENVESVAYQILYYVPAGTPPC